MLIRILLLVSFTSSQGAFYNAPYIGGNRNQLDTNPAMAQAILRQFGGLATGMCTNIPAVGSPALGIRAFLRNVDHSLTVSNPNTRFHFIYHNEVRENNKLYITSVARLLQINGEGGYFIHKLVVNPYANPNIKTVLYYFTQDFAKVQALAGTNTTIDKNGFVGCGDAKASWSAYAEKQNARPASSKSAPQNPATSRISNLPQYSGFIGNQANPILNTYVQRAIGANS